MYAIRREDVVNEYLNNIRTTNFEQAVNQAIINTQKIYRHLKMYQKIKSKA